VSLNRNGQRFPYYFGIIAIQVAELQLLPEEVNGGNGLPILWATLVLEEQRGFLYPDYTTGFVPEIVPRSKVEKIEKDKVS